AIWLNSKYGRRRGIGVPSAGRPYTTADPPGPSRRGVVRRTNRLAVPDHGTVGFPSPLGPQGCRPRAGTSRRKQDHVHAGRRSARSVRRRIPLGRVSRTGGPAAPPGRSHCSEPIVRQPPLRALMERRILVNYRVDPDLLAAALPPPFRPVLVDGL